MPTHKQRTAVDTLRRFVESNPIATATLWHHDKPRTSQQEAVRRALKPGLFCGIMLGGNRSGKTEAGAMLAAAYALGAEDPSVVIWAKRNGLDAELESIPAKPGVVCCSAITGNDSIRVQREKVATYLPADTRWSNRHGHGEATAHLPTGGMIIFKSNDQRERAFQGADWDLIWFDEEHDEPVFNEARMRLVDRSGRAIFTMTPLKGRTWVWKRFVSDPEPRSMNYALSARDNPHVPQEYLEALLRRYGPHERAARESGEFTSLEGRIYPFDRNLHVISDYGRPPPDHPIFVGIDFGTRNPFAAVFCALDPSDDTLIVYDLHYKANWTLSKHAKMIKKKLGKREPEWIVADPEDRGSRLSLAREFDISNIPARKGRGSVRRGINDVSERLQPDVEGRPHLFVSDRCRALIDEFEGYCWDERRGGESIDKPKSRQADHALDALRYVCTRLSHSTFAVG